MDLHSGTVKFPYTALFRSLVLNYNGGQLGGAPFILSSKLRVSSSAAPTVFLIASTQNQLQSDIPWAEALRFEVNNTYGSSAVNGTNGFANLGLLRLEAVDS